jgi:antitoxin CptB
MSLAGPAEVQLRRLRMRSWRRGTREMDLILGGFADGALEALGPSEIEAYEAVLAENDHDLYGWIAGRSEAPAALQDILGRIRQFHGVS